MDQSPVSDQDNEAPAGGPARITAIYAAVAALWILASDSLVGLIIETPRQAAIVSALKGWAFVLLTAVILYGLMKRMIRKHAAMHSRIAKEQAAKLEALKFLEVISEKSTDAIYIKDTAGRYLMFNREAGRFVGKDSSQVIGLDDRALFLPGEAEALMAADRRIMEQGEIRTFEEVMTTPQAVRTFLTTKGPLYNDSHGLIGLFGIARDISERKNAEETLRRSEELLREVQAVANLGHYVFRVQDDRWESSEILDRLFGIGPDYQRDAAHWLALVAPDNRQKTAEYLASIMASGDRFDHEYAIRRVNDGELRWMAGLGRIERDEAGQAVRLVGTIQDITDRIVARNAMLEKSELLMQSNTDLEQFAYVASHDLQTPLRNIVSYAQLLEHRYKGRIDSDADDFIGFIVDSGRQMTLLIADLLEYSRVTSQARPLNPAEAGEAVTQAIRNLKRELDDTGAEVTIGPLPAVMAEHSLLVSLFQNLLGNGLKYRAQGRAARLSVTAERHGPDRWRFAVADNGIGIESQYFDKIFQIFQRLSPSTVTEGTGIGLTLCRRIVHHFGGTIWVESTPGSGTTIFFSLRAAPERQA
jgi:PAS domain S-box-containing protein